MRKTRIRKIRPLQKKDKSPEDMVIWLANQLYKACIKTGFVVDENCEGLTIYVHHKITMYVTDMIQNYSIRGKYEGGNK